MNAFGLELCVHCSTTMFVVPWLLGGVSMPINIFLDLACRQSSRTAICQIKSNGEAPRASAEVTEAPNPGNPSCNAATFLPRHPSFTVSGFEVQHEVYNNDTRRIYGAVQLFALGWLRSMDPGRGRYRETHFSRRSRRLFRVLYSTLACISHPGSKWLLPNSQLEGRQTRVRTLCDILVVNISDNMIEVDNARKIAVLMPDSKSLTENRHRSLGPLYAFGCVFCPGL